MKIRLHCLLFTGALCALALTARSQIVQFNASLTAAQETTASTSTATGSAIMLYDVSANTFDLIVNVSDLANSISGSHIHEGAVGAAGPVVTNLGGEAVYFRNGNTVTAVFRGITHLGAKLTLLQNGAYYNIHSAQFPGGEIRGQLIAQPKRLVANLTVAQEIAAFPANTTLANANLPDFGGAVMFFNPGTSRISVRISLFNFRNVLNNSHFHEGAPAVSGPVVVGLGNNANAGGYNTTNAFIDGSFDIPYTADPVKLLTGGAYLNFHSTTFGPGEIRGQVRASDEVPSSRFINLSTRGNVGTGSAVLIAGFSVLGPDPIRLLISAKGPSLSAYGVTGVLADPTLQLIDAAGRQIAFNDNIGTPAATSELAAIPGAPSNAAESALLVVLPPGNYTAVVAGAGGTGGVALLEVTDLRIIGPAVGSATQVIASLPKNASSSQRKAALERGLELCTSLPLAVAAVKP